MTLEIPGYEIVREVGRGAMATVYLAIRKSLERPVALKILTPALTSDPNFQERFHKEGQIIAQLKHPHIVTVHDIGRHGDYFYMDLEYAGGGSLQARAQTGLNEAEAVRLVIQIADALSFAHKHNIVHRDIKPGNILFREDGTALLSDFGIAKALGSDSNLTAMGLTVGTPSYMSPEQVSGKLATTQSDIYSLGVMFYEILAGSKPYVADESVAVALMHVQTPIPQLPEHLIHLQPVIDRSMAKSLLDRYKTGDELIRDLLAKRDNITALRTSDYEATIEGLHFGESGHTRPEEITRCEEIAHPEEINGRTSTVRSVESTWTLRTRANWILASALIITLAAAAGYWHWARQEGDPRDIDLASLNIDIELPEARIRKQANALLEVGRKYGTLSQRYPIADEDTTLFDDVVRKLVDLITFANSTGNKDLALDLSYEALALAPSSGSLSVLKSQILAGTRERALNPAEQEEVDQLLADAESHIGAVRFALPEGANALDSYRKVLAIDPGNQTALAKLAQLAERFLRQANLDISRQEYEAAGDNVEVGLMFDPTHEGLRELSARFQPTPRL